MDSKLRPGLWARQRRRVQKPPRTPPPVERSGGARAGPKLPRLSRLPHGARHSWVTLTILIGGSFGSWANQQLPRCSLRSASPRMLAHCLRGKSPGAARPELEADKPFAGDAVTAGFRGSKLPASRRLQSEISEVFAGPGRVQCGIRDSPSRIDLDAHADANDTPNGGE